MKKLFIIFFSILMLVTSVSAKDFFEGKDYWQQKDSAHFTVLYTDSRIAHKTADMLEKMYEEYFEFFESTDFAIKRPVKKLEWVIFDSQQEFINYSTVSDFMDMSYVDGYYSSRTNRVALMKPDSRQVSREDSMPPAFGFDRKNNATVKFENHSDESYMKKVAHEAAHQLSFNSKLQNKDSLYPFWVSEGIAMNFENIALVDFGAANQERKEHLIKCYRQGRLLSFEQLIVITKVPCFSASEVRTLYSQSWGFFNFLYKNYSSELKDYLKFLASETSIHRDKDQLLKEFKSHFKDYYELKAQWYIFLEELQ